MDSSPLTGLLACPQEVLDNILAEVRPKFVSIAAVTRVCRKLYSAATPSLYQSVVIWQPVNVDRFARIIKDKPHLIPFIRRLQVHYHDIPDAGEDQPHMFQLLDLIGFQPTIAKLVNLESLVMKADCLPRLEQPHLFRRPEILPNLLSCKVPITLMSSSDSNILGVLGHDSSVWELWKIKPVYAALIHPSLENLTLTHCAIKAHTQNRHKNGPLHPTPLKRLWLLNCRIGATRLAEIMKYPRALKHITFKCEARGFQTDIHRIQTRQRYVEAIKLQSSSLESLDLDIYLPWGKRTNLTSFSLLRDLTITPSHLAGNPTDDDYPEYSAVPMIGLLPPSLEHLTFRDSISRFRLYDSSRLERNSHIHEDFHLRDVYQLVARGELPHLSRFTCVLAPPFSADDSETAESGMANISLQTYALKAEMFDATRTFTQAFHELGVLLDISQTDHSISMPENDEFKCPHELSSYRAEPTRYTFW
ncbi:hypothetical protein N7453_009553 [Penicillium expansum]|nr:hypothetical protein N7453_009553 [Penicillium expansum]